MNKKVPLLIGFAVLLIALSSLIMLLNSTDITEKDLTTPASMAAAVAALLLLTCFCEGTWHSKLRARLYGNIGLSIALYIPIVIVIMQGPKGWLTIFTMPLAEKTLNIIPEATTMAGKVMNEIGTRLNLEPVQMTSMIKWSYIILLGHILYCVLRIFWSYGPKFMITFAAAATSIVICAKFSPMSGGWLLFSIASVIVILGTIAYKYLDKPMKKWFIILPVGIALGTFCFYLKDILLWMEHPGIVGYGFTISATVLVILTLYAAPEMRKPSMIS